MPLKRMLNIKLLNCMSAGILFFTACAKGPLSSLSSQDFQFVFSPSSGTSFLYDSIISVSVIDSSPICKDLSDGNGLFFEDTRIDKCTMTVNGVDSGSSYQSGFVCNETQTQATPMLHLPLQTTICYGGISTFTVTVTCTHNDGVVGEGTATYYCVY